MEDRFLIIVTNDGGDVVAQLLLNNDQLRLLQWLIDREWLNQDYVNFQIMDKADTLIII